MDSDLPSVCRFFAATCRSGVPLVLATVLRTEGSTYRKAGACALLDSAGASSGILSGGCLEADLRERACAVLSARRPARVTFDTRPEEEDLVWGLGLGCQGLMEVWLQPVSAQNSYDPLPYLQQCWEREHGGMIATVVGGEALPAELGQHGYPGRAHDGTLGAMLCQVHAASPELRTIEFNGRKLEIFATPITLPPSLLLCGGGPDAIPITSFAAALNWRVILFDHRPAFAQSANFPQGTRVILGQPNELARRIDISKIDAAVIMSHHFPSDVEYLRQLAHSPPGYVGALGPALRRERLLTEAGAQTEVVMRGRIYGPAGLAIGAKSPESIALSIVAQAYAICGARKATPR